MSDELVAFLRARLDEDERDPGGWSVKRVLAEVDTKRRMMELHDVPNWVSPKPGHSRETRMCDGCGFGRDGEPVVDDIDYCPVLRLLALPYRGHPDYRPEWAPGA